MTHGTTLHGAQRLRDLTGNLVSDVTPGTYYYPGSPMAAAVKIVQARLDAEGELGRFGVVGLGAGSLSCYSRKHEAWRFFEIDPIVVDIAAKSNHFTFLANCQPKLDAVIGDARLTLAKEPDKSFDLIIVDAFTSDAVPVHLMTAEALQLYASKLTDNGVVVLHISNRYLDLDSVLGATLPLVPDLKGSHRLRRQGRRQLRPEHLDHRRVRQEPGRARPLPGGRRGAGLPSGRTVAVDGRRLRYPRPLPVAVAPLVGDARSPLLSSRRSAGEAEREPGPTEGCAQLPHTADSATSNARSRVSLAMLASPGMTAVETLSLSSAPPSEVARVRCRS